MLSLRAKIVLLLILGYVLPATVMVSILADFIASNYNQQVIEKVELSLEETTELSTVYLSTMIEDSRRLSYEGMVESSYRQYLDGGTAEDLYKRAQINIDGMYRYNSLFLSAVLFFEDESLDPLFVTNDSTRSQAGVARTNQGMRGELEAFTETLGRSLGFYSQQGRLYLVRNLLDSSFQPYGILSLELDINRILGAFQGIAGVLEVLVTVDEAEISTGESEGEHITYRYSQKVDNHQLGVEIRVDNGATDHVLAEFQAEITLILFTILPAIAYMLFNFYRHITSPLNSLVQAAREMESGRLGYQIKNLPSSGEFKVLAKAFNSMSRSMKEQFEQSYQEQLALQDARMKTLQRQINPHFLNNTLEIINWETRIAGATNATNMIESLSVMLRATMDREGQGKIPLHQELTYVDAYLYIQSCRMGTRLTVEKQIDPETLKYHVPRLAFQPLVENACEHGVSGQKKGRIVVSSFISYGNLILEVKNSGHMSEETQEHFDKLLEWDKVAQDYVSDSSSMGVRNVNHRVKLMYGEAYGVDFFNNNEEMTVIRLALPLQNAPYVESDWIMSDL